jgi:hypothetical protein
LINNNLVAQQSIVPKSDRIILLIEEDDNTYRNPDEYFVILYNSKGKHFWQYFNGKEWLAKDSTEFDYANMADTSYFIFGFKYKRYTFVTSKPIYAKDFFFLPRKYNLYFKNCHLITINFRTKKSVNVFYTGHGGVNIEVEKKNGKYITYSTFMSGEKFNENEYYNSIMLKKDAQLPELHLERPARLSEKHPGPWWGYLDFYRKQGWVISETP